MPRWLDKEALADLDKLIALYQMPSDWKALKLQCQRISQWIEHGRITEPVRARLKSVLPQAEEVLRASVPTN